MQIPKFGGARGILEMLVPGVFLLMNFTVLIYYFPYLDEDTKIIITNIVANSSWSVNTLLMIILVIFGYLIGVVLRLFRTNKLDRCSQKYLKFLFHLRNLLRRKRNRNKNIPLYIEDEFPYILHLEDECDSMPNNVKKFYEEHWLTKKGKKHEITFFNFCKIMINSLDDRATREIYYAESLSRYISGMFFALKYSIYLIGITIVINIIHPEHKILYGLFIFLLAYLYLIHGILKNFRFLRIKEVCTVFIASYFNQSIFEENPRKLFLEKVEPQDENLNN